MAYWTGQAMRGTWGHLAKQDQKVVLGEITGLLLAEEGQSFPDWEVLGPQIADDIGRQSDQLIADARTDYDAYERLRAMAVRALDRADPMVSGLTGALAGYLFLVIAGPKFLPLAAANPGIGLAPWILAVLLIALAIRWTLRQRWRATLARSVPAAYDQWIGVLRDQVLRPFVVERRNDEVRNPRLFDTSIGEKSPPRLIEGSEPRRLVVTEAMTRLSVTAQSVYSGSLGVSGPRGVGKSTILEFFGMEAGDSRDLGLVVSAPVDYEPREFIIHLFSQLCEAIPHGPAERSTMAAETRRNLEQLRYLRTYTASWSASLAPRSFISFARGYAKERAELPVTLPELVDHFRSYCAQVAAWHRSAHGEKGRVVIGIDEVDKIRDSDRAEAFLNDIKAIFGVPGCLYLVTLSEDAMAGFARQTPSIRNAFDSAFDELVPVGPMSYRHSEQLLFKRVTGVPRPFIALCHVLSGGLPRDLVRTARALIDVTPATGEKLLPETAGDLIGREVESLRQESVRQLASSSGSGSLLAALHDSRWPGATPRQFTNAALHVASAARDAESEGARQVCSDVIVSLSFYATALDIFGTGRDRLVESLKVRDYSMIDELAGARFAMRVNNEFAHQLLEQFRLKNGLWSGHASK